MRPGGALSTQQAVDFINTDDAQPIDLRSAADFERGHIINAVNIPPDEMKKSPQSIEKFKAQPLLLYCASGPTATATMRQLKRQGFENVRALKGGVGSWRSDNLPLTTP